LMDLVVF